MSFHMLIGHLYIFFSELFGSFAHVLIGLLIFLLLSFKNSLYMLTSFFLLIFIYVCIYLFMWLCRVLVAAWGISSRGARAL